MENQLTELAIEVFQAFARIEYSLKAAGLHNGDGDAVPNWRLFAESVADTFAAPTDPAFREAVDYMLAHPPKKQIVVGDVLTWSEAKPNTELKSDLVLIYVRRVRNNLFHGGKFNGRWFEPERSEQLLRHSLTILNVCRDSCNPVRDAFYG